MQFQSASLSNQIKQLQNGYQIIVNAQKSFTEHSSIQFFIDLITDAILRLLYMDRVILMEEIQGSKDSYRISSAKGFNDNVAFTSNTHVKIGSHLFDENGSLIVNGKTGITKEIREVQQIFSIPYFIYTSEILNSGIRWLLFAGRLNEKPLMSYYPLSSVDSFTLRSLLGFLVTMKQKLDQQDHLEKMRVEKEALILGQNRMLEEKVVERTRDLTFEKKKSDDLLLNILPSEVAEELKQNGKAEAKQYNHVTVLFTDFVNFTGISEKLSPKELVEEIDRCFRAFDDIMGRNGMEKIKTIGDAYMAVCGLPIENTDHAGNAVRAAIEIRNFMNGTTSQINSDAHNPRFQIRIGLHSGSVIAGIVGNRKFAYDIWGDTVNMASRMESSGEPGKINISGSTYEHVKKEFDCTYRGKIKAKNKGEVEMYFVT